MRVSGWMASLSWSAPLAIGLLLTPGVRAQMPQTPQVPLEPKKEAPKEEPKKEDLTQPPTTPSSQDSQSPDSSDTGDSTSTFDSAVGYIDKAIPTSLVRLRFDAAYRNNRPTRAEYFYPRGGRFGPGLPVFEPLIDYQELATYVEYAVQPELSIFLNVPIRFLNPQVNDNHQGFSDLSAGFKYAFISEPDLVTSFQLQTWAPTGYSRRGLGTRHVSIEPAFLMWTRLTDRVVMESELRYWMPAGGTDFAGDIIRYGVGFGYGERSQCGLWAMPVVEFVGWTVLSGKEAVGPAPTAFVDAAGDTIVNVKAGVRVGNGDRSDLYLGYGRALTGAVWYKDIVRVEYRLHF